MFQNDDVNPVAEAADAGIGMKPFEFDGGYLSSSMDTCTGQAVDRTADNEMQIDGMNSEFVSIRKKDSVPCTVRS